MDSARLLISCYHHSAMPVVASYSTTFLKKEMRHIYRQVTGLKRFETFVITDERLNDSIYPFDDIEELPPLPRNPARKFYLKYIRRTEPLIYRGQFAQIDGILRRRKADLLHVYFGHTGVHLLPLLRKKTLPALVSFHGADVILPERRPRYAARMRELLETVDLVLARSESLADRIRELGCPPDKIRLNRTSIPVNDFPFIERAFPDDGSWRLLQACRLIHKKGLPTALKAFAHFLKEHPKARFVIAGEGPEETALRKRARELGIDHAIDLVGFQNPADLKRHFEAAHIFLHPSEITRTGDREGVPNSMLEAMATGLPIAATRHGGIPEAVRDNIDGILCPEHNADALARALISLTENPERWKTMGKNAAESVRQNFSPDAQISALESCYDEVLAKSPK